MGDELSPSMTGCPRVVPKEGGFPLLWREGEDILEGDIFKNGDRRSGGNGVQSGYKVN